jgi:hypothetical protein
MMHFAQATLWEGEEYGAKKDNSLGSSEDEKGR